MTILNFLECALCSWMKPRIEYEGVIYILASLTVFVKFDVGMKCNEWQKLSIKSSEIPPRLQLYSHHATVWQSYLWGVWMAYLMHLRWNWDELQGGCLMDNCYFIHLSLTDCYVWGGYFHTSFTRSASTLDSIKLRDSCESMHTYPRARTHTHTNLI